MPPSSCSNVEVGSRAPDTKLDICFKLLACVFLSLPTFGFVCYGIIHDAFTL